MKKIGFLLLAVFLTGVTVTQAQKKQYAIYAVAFYNLENLFDTINQPNTNDEEFTPSGSYRWGGLKYRNKLNNLAYAISNFATDNSSPFKLKNGPAVIGVSEIENEQVLEDLIHTGELSKRNYGIVHYDSPDFRGIDVGLIYDKDQFTLESSRSARLHTPQFPDLRTRDQLVVSGILAGERVHFIVNHWPSRLGGEKQSSPKREAAAALTKHLADSLLAADPDSKVIIMGDLNDDPSNRSCKTVLGAKKKQQEVQAGGYFNTMWEMFDKIENQVDSIVHIGNSCAKKTKKDLNFDHNDIRDKISEIGAFLGFKLSIEKKVADGAVVDTLWEATIGNMGRIIYVFEVQTSGSIDSLILNLIKAHSNKAVQGIVAVSNSTQLEKIKKEVYSTPLKNHLKYLDYTEVLKIHEALQYATEKINTLGLVPDGF